MAAGRNKSGQRFSEPCRFAGPRPLCVAMATFHAKGRFPAFPLFQTLEPSMGVVVRFPYRGPGRRRPFVWALVGACAVSLAALGIALAGRDLLRGAQASPPDEAAESSSLVIGCQAAVCRNGLSHVAQLEGSSARRGAAPAEK